MPDATAETVAERLLEDVISTFGMPEYLHTDQGSQFKFAVFQQLCTLLGVENPAGTNRQKLKRK